MIDVLEMIECWKCIHLRKSGRTDIGHQDLIILSECWKHYFNLNFKPERFALTEAKF